MEYLTPNINFVVGIIVGILLTFSCIRISLILPMISPVPKVKEDKKKKRAKVRWDPGSLMPPPSSSMIGSYGPGPSPSSIEYESPYDYLDPVDPKKESQKEG